MKTKNLLTVLVFAGTFCASCTQDDSFSTPSQEATGEDLFKFTLPTRAGDKADGVVSSLHAYAFSEGQYLRKFENIDVSTDNFQLSLPADKQKKIVFSRKPHAPDCLRRYLLGSGSVKIGKYPYSCHPTGSILICQSFRRHCGYRERRHFPDPRCRPYRYKSGN